MNWHNITVYAALILIFLGTLQLYTYVHEKAHEANCKGYGGQPLTMIGWFEGKVACYNLTSTQTNEWAQDNIVDGVGYQLLPIIWLLYLIFMVLTLALFTH